MSVIGRYIHQVKVEMGALLVWYLPGRRISKELSFEIHGEKVHTDFTLILFAIT